MIRRVFIIIFIIVIIFISFIIFIILIFPLLRSFTRLSILFINKNKNIFYFNKIKN